MMPGPESSSDDSAIDRKLDFMREWTDSAASHPGRLRISMVKYWLSFPKWPTIWAFGFSIALGLSLFFHWGFVCLAIPLAAINWWYWWIQRSMFIAGCVNPSRVVSVDPPLIAALTDLTKDASPTKWNYIKVLKQPLSSMTGGPPQLGQKLSTIAYYEQSDHPEHWNDFHPSVVNCVTWTQLEIDRISKILPESEWRDLDEGLRQLPVPPRAGLYKVEIDLPQRHTPLSRQELTDWIDLYLSELPSHGSCMTLQNTAMPDLVSAANRIEPTIGGQDVLAVVTAPDQSAGHHGFILSTLGLHYRLSDNLRGTIPWNNMWGSGYATDGLEIVLRNGSRVRFGHRLGEFSRLLEQLFDGIAKSREPVLR